MSRSKAYQVFVCHRWQYTEDLISLKKLIERQTRIQISYHERSVEEAIDSENAQKITKQLQADIINADIVLAIASVYASRSQWME